MVEISAAIAQTDAKRLERAAHSLKGSVGNFGVGAAYNTSLKLETMGRAGDLAHAVQAFHELEEQIELLKPNLAGLAKVDH
jgi:HPt (histidine-containing phosphotransfer) domain-containing protein